MSSSSSSSRLINSIRCIGVSRDIGVYPNQRLAFDKVFSTELSLINIAERVYLKLRELDFRLLGFSEIHLHFYPDTNVGVKNASSDGVHLWKRDVLIAISLTQWRRLDQFEQEEELIKLICQACRFVSSNNNLEIVDTAETALLEQRERLSIKVFEKSIKSYRIGVFCLVPSTEGQIASQILYEDNKTGQWYRADFVKTGYVPELIHLCGLVTVKNGEITVLPRKGHFASSIAWKYGSPIRFQISNMVSVK